VVKKEGAKKVHFFYPHNSSGVNQKKGELASGAPNGSMEGKQLSCSGGEFTDGVRKGKAIYNFYSYEERGDK